MRRYVIGIVIALLTFTVGVGLSLLWDIADSLNAIDTSEQHLVDGGFDISLPVNSYNFGNRIFDVCPLIERTIVISIPNDGEFYLGKNRVTEAEIPDKVRQMLNARPLDERVAYIKAADSVKYGTVFSIKERLNETGVTRIELVRNKKRELRQAKTD